MQNNKVIAIFRNKIGIDTAIIYTAFSRIIQGGSGFLSMLFVIKFLDKFEQGYFYTFGSIIALQVFFELGLTSIITQFTAHEFANLKFINKYTLDGDLKNLSRVSSLLHLSVKWFSVLSILLFVFLTIIGFIFFQNYGNNSVDWFYPWLILVLTSSLNLLVIPILSFLEGLGKVKEVAMIRLVQYSIQAIFVLLLLSNGFHLYSSAIANFFAFIVIPFFLYFSYRKKLIINIWKNNITERVNYIKEILPFQWKISISWISGYFIYQLINPIVFATEGAIIAGQIGLSLAVLNGIQSISLSWLNTKIPFFSTAIAQRKFDTLDLVFKKTMIQSTAVSFVGILFFLFVLNAINLYIENFSQRFLEPKLLYVLAFSVITNQFVSGLAIYLRCHKREPFLYFSILIAVTIVAGIFLLGKLYGIWGIILFYSFVISCISLPIASWIFYTKRKLWHYDEK